MPDIETLLRATLSERADDATPRPEAIDAAISAVRRRHRSRVVVSSLVAAAAVGAIAVTVSAWPHALQAPSPVAVTMPSPTSSSTSEVTTGPPPGQAASSTASSTTAASIDAQAAMTNFLMAVLGTDYTPPSVPLLSGVGSASLSPGSRSAEGLPGGYTASATLNVLDEMSDTYAGPVKTIVEACAPLVEKGATTEACVPLVRDGVTVQLRRTDAVNTTVQGTFSTVTVLYSRPDGKVQAATLGVVNSSPTTAQQRSQAAVWLNRQTDKLIVAAVTPVR